MAKTSALPLLAGGAALLLLSNSKKKSGLANLKTSWADYGILVDKDCSTVNVTNTRLFHSFVNVGFRELVAANPSITLVEISDALFYKVAPKCSGFPNEPESGSVTDLYMSIASLVDRLMILSGKKTADKDIKLGSGSGDDYAKIADWHQKWHNYPSPTLPPAPANQVAFSSDLSRFKIGPDWYEETVLPFVIEAAAEGRIDTALEDFMGRGVAFGRLIVAISELPKDAPRVQAFLAELEDAIQEAKEEVG